MDKKRIVFLLIILLASAGGLKYNEMRAEQARHAEEARAKAVALPPKPVRNWRFKDEPEWVVHQVVRQLVSWSLDETSAVPTLAVRHDPGALAPLEVTFRGGAVPAITVQPVVHLWDPSAYAQAAAAILGTGAGDSGAPVPEVNELLLASDTESLLKADSLLFAALNARRRDARLHEQAALLWAAHAMRESAQGRLDPAPFLNGVTAHLAIARALAPGRPPGSDAAIAAIVIDVLLQRQTDALSALEGLTATFKDPSTAAWADALRVRVTHDPRLKGARPPATRIEKLEYLIALRASRQDCGIVIPTARSWNVAPAADWAREALRCFDEEYLARVGDPMTLQTEDARRLAQVDATSPLEIIAALNARSKGETHQPGRPSAVVPLEVRADAGLRHIAQAYETVLNGVLSKGWKDGARIFNESAEAVRVALPHDPFLEVAPNARRPGSIKPGADVCARMGRLVSDRPDLLSRTDWVTVRDCLGEPALKGVDRHGWDELAIAGTGMTATGPWHVGPAIYTPAYDEAVARAPWDVGRAWVSAYQKAKGAPSTAEVLAVYSRVLDYDTNAMARVLPQIEDADEIQRLAERVCGVEADACAEAGRRLSVVGRFDAALPLGKRALERAQGQIGLSNSMSWYVSLLQERGRTAEAMRIARRMADVYSEGGLQTLAKAHERMGEFKEAASVYRLISERYGETSDEDEFYIRHAQRYGAAPFESETAEAVERIFPNGLRTISIDQAAQAKKPLSLNDRRVFANNLSALGLSHWDAFVAVDGYVVETPEQYYAVYTFKDDADFVFLVKRKDGRVEEVKGKLYRAHYDVVAGGRKPKGKKTAL